MEVYAAQTVLFQFAILVDAVEILGAWVARTASTLTDEFEALLRTVVLAPTFAPSVTSLPSILLEEMLNKFELARRVARLDEGALLATAAQIDALIVFSALSTLVEELKPLFEEVCAAARLVAAVATAVSVLADEVE
jgi:hypothetical protein